MLKINKMLKKMKESDNFQIIIKLSVLFSTLIIRIYQLAR